LKKIWNHVVTMGKHKHRELLTISVGGKGKGGDNPGKNKNPGKNIGLRARKKTEPLSVNRSPFHSSGGEEKLCLIQRSRGGEKI